MKNVLGIIGGLGPKASAYFYDMITEMTDAEKDQDHINIIILSHPTIPDRTEYILGKSTENPLPFLLEDVKTLEQMGAKMIAIPCNTSCYFHEELQKNTSVIVNNMIEDTILYLKEKNVDSVAIMATDGTLQSSLYQNACLKYGINFEIPSANIQTKIMSIIYDYVKKGINVDINIWNEIISSFKSEYIILGCTELSVLKKELKLSDKFVDPLVIQSEKIIKYFGKNIK